MRALKATTAALLVLLIIAVPPYLLVRFIGNPWPPEGVSLASPLTDNAILGLIAVVVWILWAQLTLSLLVEAYAAIADRAFDVRLPVFGFQQDIARALVGAVLATAAIAPLITGAVTHSAAAAEPTSSLQVVSTTAAAAASNEAAHPQPQLTESSVLLVARLVAENTTKVQVHVDRGDTLWSMAEHYLGDGNRWAEIAEANQGKTMVDGRVFTSADQIRPGWVLTIPGAADDQHSMTTQQTSHQDKTGSQVDYRVKRGDSLSSIAHDQLGDPQAYPAIFAASQGIAQPMGRKLVDPQHIEPDWTLSIPTMRPSDGAHRDFSHPRPVRSDHGASEAPAVEAAGSSRLDADSADTAGSLALPGGVGAVLASLLLGLLARRSAAQGRRRERGNRHHVRDDPAERVEAEMRSVAADFTVDFVDCALRRLAAESMATRHRLPQVQGVRVTSQRLELYFESAPLQPLPAPWQFTSDPAIWTLAADSRQVLRPESSMSPSAWPALVSVGHDSEGGIVLLNLLQRQGLVVAGEHHLTSQVMVAMAIELGTAPWAADLDLTVVGSLVELPELLDRDRMRYVPTSHHVRIDPDRAHVVIAMFPLSNEQEQDLIKQGAVTIVQAAVADGGAQGRWSIEMLSAECAIIGPIGLRVTPQRVDASTYKSILELLTGSLSDVPDGSTVVRRRSVGEIDG